MRFLGKNVRGGDREVRLVNRLKNNALHVTHPRSSIALFRPESQPFILAGGYPKNPSQIALKRQADVFNRIVTHLDHICVVPGFAECGLFRQLYLEWMQRFHDELHPCLLAEAPEAKFASRHKEQ